MRRLLLLVLAGLLVVPPPASAQLRDLWNKAKQKKDQVDSKTAKEQKAAKKISEANKDWTPEQEEEVGENTAAKIIHAFGGLNEEPNLVRYVNLVGDTVALQGARTDVQYHFAILDTMAINAMALPGGFVFITSGALAVMTDEAQLAGVLGHEIAHVDGKHLERELKSQATYGALAELGKDEAAQGTSRTGFLQKYLDRLADRLAAMVATAPYSKGDESSADKRGLDFAAKAGYDPRGLRNFLQVLAEAAKDEKNQQTLGAWQQTHPPFDQRVAALDELIKKLNAGGQTLAERYQDSVIQKPPPAPAKSSATKSGATKSGAPAKKSAPSAAPKKSPPPAKGQ